MTDLPQIPTAPTMLAAQTPTTRPIGIDPLLPQPAVVEARITEHRRQIKLLRRLLRLVKAAHGIEDEPTESKPDAATVTKADDDLDVTATP